MGTGSVAALRSRKGFVLFWTALFILSIGLQYVAAMAPRTALAADGDPVVELQDGVNGCQGVLPTPGSENTNKRLIGGSLEPGGTATFEISYPVSAEDVSGRETFVITDCVFIDTAGRFPILLKMARRTRRPKFCATCDVSHVSTHCKRSKTIVSARTPASTHQSEAAFSGVQWLVRIAGIKPEIAGMHPVTRMSTQALISLPRSSRKKRQK